MSKTPLFKRFVDQSGRSGCRLYGKFTEEMRASLTEAPPQRLYMGQGEWGGYEFLKEPWAREVVEYVNEYGSVPIDGITNLQYLETLVLDVETQEEFSFETFTKLKWCSIRWQKRFQHDLFGLPLLAEARISSYDQKDVSAFNQASGNLRKLELDGGRVTNVAHIKKLKSLESLWLTRMRYLVDISGFAGMGNLEELAIESCNAIEDYDAIGKLRGLKKLFIENKTIPSIGFLKPLTRLEELHLAGTNVEDGDLGVLLTAPSLKLVSMKNKKHYSHKLKTINEAIKKNRNNQR